MSDDQEPTRGLHQLVLAHLGPMIASGELPAGHQIVPEVLIEELGVSRPVIREALRVLQAKGMVLPRPKVGTRVLPVAYWNLLDQDVIAWRIRGPARQQQLSELTDLRFAVEILAARRSASHATTQQVAALRAACDAMAEAIGRDDQTAFTEADIVFHTVILEASGNEIFGHFASAFAAFLHAREDLHTLPEKLDLTVVQNHREIVHAIATGDQDEAERSTRSLIEQARLELDLTLADPSVG